MDVPLFESIIKLIKDIKPNRIILAGDIADCYAVSKFSKSQSKAEDVQWEFDCVHALLVQLRSAAKTSQIDYVAGNHENRLIKYLNSRAKELRGLRDLTIERQLRLKELGINYLVDYAIISNSFIVAHGCKGTDNPAKKEIESRGVSGISGHCHRSSKCSKSDIFGNKKTWYSIGHLAIAREMDYASDFWHTWDQSFAIVEKKNEDIRVTIVEVDKEGFIYGEKSYSINRN